MDVAVPNLPLKDLPVLLRFARTKFLQPCNLKSLQGQIAYPLTPESLKRDLRSVELT